MKRVIRAAEDISGSMLGITERIHMFGDDPQGDIVIPNGVTSISYGAFQGCTSLTKITIPNSVKSIKFEAFRDCTSLTEVIILNNDTSIDDAVFFGCSSLTKITIPNGVTRIGYSAFVDCTSLTKITIPNKITKIRGYMFHGCTSLTEVIIPSSVTEIGFSAFKGCVSLTKIIIPKSITTIGHDAFHGCTSLTEVTFEGDLNRIMLEERSFKDTPVEKQLENYVEKDTNSTKSRLTNWGTIKKRLQSDLENGYDPLYERTEVGECINDICAEVESELGIWLEPSIQGGVGGIYIYSNSDDQCIAENIDYESFNEAVVDLALVSTSKQNFKIKYRSFLNDKIDSH